VLGLTAANQSLQYTVNAGECVRMLIKIVPADSQRIANASSGSVLSRLLQHFAYSVSQFKLAHSLNTNSAVMRLVCSKRDQILYQLLKLHYFGVYRLQLSLKRVALRAFTVQLLLSRFQNLFPVVSLSGHCEGNYR